MSDRRAIISPARIQFENGLLSCLNLEGRERIEACMKPVELQTRQILYYPEEHITDIYFPKDCVIVMLTIMSNGATIESATVGREGASWISASFESPTMPCQTMVSIPGSAYVVPAQVIEEEIERNGDFHKALSNYSHALLLHTLRSTACNGLHSLEQRCCRWMLTTLDRTDLAKFEITHDFLSNLLGVRRAGVSVLVERLAAEGILEVSRGRIQVKDRSRLEAISCECYFVIREQFRNLKMNP